ncbi:MAG: alanine--tRNA ligase [Ruminococcaceae bacterium]|nr:alanine--tRNA ligase [Oscillospiraceae bacterium]
MEWTGVNDLREQYLSFFESKDHLRHKSFSLVPSGDKSLLLINAGMAPLKKYFTGEIEPPRRRMTTCQKCIRTPDIDRVGITARHGTYFEMLGNFSFGDYFKKEAITWAWEFITEVIKLPKDKLWVTIYLDDDEAYDIWANKIGVDPEKIVRLGKEDNFWEHGSGPCGPCSEIHFDRGEKFGCGKPDCKPGCDCDRFMEFWNLVFTQFDSDGKGTYTRLANPNIDTGMGLERLACIMQGVNNLFEVDTVRNIMASISAKAGVSYGEGEKTDISLRVVTDHIRSTTFMVCDGVVPSNEGRGYVLRRLLRRAARHGKMLGIKGTFLSDIVEVVAKENYTEYPELTEKLDYIKKVVRIEEERFATTIDAGLAILSGICEKCQADGKTVIDGADIFKLYDTFGFPVDITREIAKEAGLGLDEDGFTALMAEQRTRARAARANISGWSENSKNLLSDFAETEFTGYTETSSKVKVLGIIADEINQEKISEGDFTLILDKTPFYAESGGQVGDSGVITAEGVKITVNDVKKQDGVFLHFCTVDEGEIFVGEELTASIDTLRRMAIARNHSSCHMLQAALRKVLGNHVEQAGSYVDANRARFDFSHYAALTPEEIKAVEDIVNAAIFEAIDVNTVVTDIETARKEGAMALFGEKYGKYVRMVKMGDFSTELCGGTHVKNTSCVGLFKIVSESSVAAGVRRIEAATGLGILELLAEKQSLIEKTAKEMKVANPLDIAKKASQLQSELKSANSEIESLEAKIANAKLESIKSSAVEISGVSVIVSKVDGITLDAARGLCDDIKSENPLSVTVFAIVNDGKANLVCACGKEAVAKGMNAGKIVKEMASICGGGGGGRPDSATAGIKDISKYPEAEARLPEIIARDVK